MASESKKTILAIVGMPGSGKSQVVAFLKKKKLPFVRFGQETEDGLAALGMPVTEKNEVHYRENLRKTLGMAAYAVKATPKIQANLAKHKVVVLDGLYSWEEYIYLKKIFSHIVLICVFADAQKRYERLAKRLLRPLSTNEAISRDTAEIERLNKGGPIAMADYFIENNGTITQLKEKTYALVHQLGIT